MAKALPPRAAEETPKMTARGAVKGAKIPVNEPRAQMVAVTPVTKLPIEHAQVDRLRNVFFLGS